MHAHDAAASAWRPACSVARACAVALVSAAVAQTSDDRRDREVSRRRCRTAIRPSCGKRAAKACGKQPRGPKKVSLEKCDLGLGPGVVKGAYAQMPRYFADADRVMDLETRLVWCMVEAAGLSRDADAKKNPFGAADAQGRHGGAGRLRHVGVARREDERRAIATRRSRRRIALGEKMFYFRGGPHDFACATCHGEDNKRIRLQDLPNLTKPEGAQKGYTTWPAYRVSQGELRTFQWRLYDCFRQQRFPELEFASDASVALTTFLAKNANGARVRRARRSSAERRTR